MKEIAEYDELIEQVVEWLGMQWRRCQIREGLLKILGEDELPSGLLDHVIELARKRIRDRLKIDPEEFRGYSLTFYSSIIRDERAGLKYRLHAQTRIDKLLGLEAINLDDPHAYAEALRNAVRGMDRAVPKGPEEAPAEIPPTVEPVDLSEAASTVTEFLKRHKS